MSEGQTNQGLPNHEPVMHSVGDHGGRGSPWRRLGRRRFEMTWPTVLRWLALIAGPAGGPAGLAWALARIAVLEKEGGPDNKYEEGLKTRRTVMLMVAFATSPALVEAQALTDCLAVDPEDQRLVDGYVFWDIDLRNDCTEEVDANWYYYAPFARDPAFPMRYYSLPVGPGNQIRVTLSWRSQNMDATPQPR